MGNYVSSVLGSPFSTRKRTRSQANLDGEADGEAIENDYLCTKKRKITVKSSQHIYEALFLNGENSDVTIFALGRPWHLHKVLLRQSGYFSSMFSGHWQETDKNFIHIDIPDGNIDEEALTVTFGSFYQDNVSINLNNVTGILAASTLFDMEDLCSECVKVMLDNINAQTVCRYYSCATVYGQDKLANMCIIWLERNLLIMHSPELLRDISNDLMSKLVSSSGLVVIQVETDIYLMLRKWLFLKLTDTSWSGTCQQLAQATDKFIKANAVEWNKTEQKTFILLPEGSQYFSIFQHLRLQHIVTDFTSAMMVAADNIIPQEWLLTACSLQWQIALKIDNRLDSGPKSLDEAAFLNNSVRCGRIIPSAGDYCWRWTGFCFGIDLVMSFTGRVLLLKRNTTSRKSNGFISFNPEHSLIYRVTAASRNEQGESSNVQCSGIKLVTLRKDEEIIVMSFDRDVTYPIYVSCNFLLHKPLTRDDLLCHVSSSTHSEESAADDM